MTNSDERPDRIPEAAVEAAAELLAMASPEDWSGDQWTNEKIHDSYRETWRDQARAILEAAAPLMHRATTTITERDEMAEVIWGVEAEDFGGYKTSVTSKAADQIAAALLTAGYRKVSE